MINRRLVVVDLDHLLIYFVHFVLQGVDLVVNGLNFVFKLTMLLTQVFILLLMLLLILVGTVQLFFRVLNLQLFLLVVEARRPPVTLELPLDVEQVFAHPLHLRRQALRPEQLVGQNLYLHCLLFQHFLDIEFAITDHANFTWLLVLVSRWEFASLITTLAAEGQVAKSTFPVVFLGLDLLVAALAHHVRVEYDRHSLALRRSQREYLVIRAVVEQFRLALNHDDKLIALSLQVLYMLLHCENVGAITKLSLIHI